jgi:hypothetical protein
MSPRELCGGTRWLWSLFVDTAASQYCCHWSFTIPPFQQSSYHSLSCACPPALLCVRVCACASLQPAAAQQHSSSSCACHTCYEQLLILAQVSSAAGPRVRQSSSGSALDAPRFAALLPAACCCGGCTSWQHAHCDSVEAPASHPHCTASASALPPTNSAPTTILSPCRQAQAEGAGGSSAGGSRSNSRILVVVQQRG